MKQIALEKVKYHLRNLKNETRVGQSKAMNKVDVESIERVLDFCKGDLNQIIDLNEVFK